MDKQQCDGAITWGNDNKPTTMWECNKEVVTKTNNDEKKGWKNNNAKNLALHSHETCSHFTFNTLQALQPKKMQMNNENARGWTQLLKVPYRGEARSKTLI